MSFWTDIRHPLAGAVGGVGLIGGLAYDAVTSDGLFGHNNGDGSGNQYYVPRPGEIDPASANPYAYAEIKKMQGYRDQYNDYTDPEMYKELAARRASAAEMNTANRYGRIGLAGSSVAFGAQDDAAYAENLRTLEERRGALQNAYSMSQGIGQGISSIQNTDYTARMAEYQQWLNAKNQEQANDAAMWSTIGTVGGGVAGAFLGGPMGAMAGASIGGSLGGLAGGGGAQRQPAGGMSPMGMMNTGWGNQMGAVPDYSQYPGVTGPGSFWANNPYGYASEAPMTGSMFNGSYPGLSY